MNDRISRGPGWDDERRPDPSDHREWRDSIEHRTSEWQRERRAQDAAQWLLDTALPEDR